MAVREFKSMCRPVGDVLDVGCMHVNGRIAGRDLWKGAMYYGVDVAKGPNVDEVVPEDGRWDLGRKFPTIVCLSCLEHCRRPWKLVETMGAHLEVGGYLLLAAPFSCHHHRYPIDCFRYAPDGMSSLCADVGLRVLRSYLLKLWPWQEITWSWKFWSLWSMVCRQMIQTECVTIAQK